MLKKNHNNILYLLFKPVLYIKDEGGCGSSKKIYMSLEKGVINYNCLGKTTCEIQYCFFLFVYITDMCCCSKVSSSA